MPNNLSPRQLSQQQVIDAALDVLRHIPQIQCAFLYGSFALGRARHDSDVDIAVAASSGPLPADAYVDLAARLSCAAGRDVDVLDLQRAHGTILAQALCKGKILLLKDKPLYARLLRKLWYEQADWMPLYRRILARRRENFLRGAEHG